MYGDTCLISENAGGEGRKGREDEDSRSASDTARERERKRGWGGVIM